MYNGQQQRDYANGRAYNHHYRHPLNWTLFSESMREWHNNRVVFSVKAA